MSTELPRSRSTEARSWSTPEAWANRETEFPWPATGSGTWKPAPSSSSGCATTSKVPRRSSAKRAFRNGSPSASNQEDDFLAARPPRRGRLRRGGGRRPWVPDLLGDVLVFICTRQPAGSRLLLVLFGGAHFRRARRHPGLRPRCPKAVPGPGHGAMARIVHPASLLSPALLHAADRPAWRARLPRGVLRD